MILETLTLVLTAAVLLVALLSLRDQRRSSTNQSKQLNGLARDIGSLNEKIEQVDRELEPWEHLAPGVRLNQGHGSNYWFLVQNNAQQAIEVLEITLAYNGKELSGRARPKEGKAWKIDTGSTSQIQVMFNDPPVSTLLWKEPGLPSGNCIDIEVVLVFRLSGIVRTARPKLYVTADLRNSSMTQYGP